MLLDGKFLKNFFGKHILYFTDICAFIGYFDTESSVN